jgi:hypothetical protein
MNRRQVKALFIQYLYARVTLKHVGEPAMLVSNKMDLAYIRQNDGAAAIIGR